MAVELHHALGHDHERGCHLPQGPTLRCRSRPDRHPRYVRNGACSHQSADADTCAVDDDIGREPPHQIFARARNRNARRADPGDVGPCAARPRDARRHRGSLCPVRTGHRHHDSGRPGLASGPECSGTLDRSDRSSAEICTEDCSSHCTEGCIDAREVTQIGAADHRHRHRHRKERANCKNSKGRETREGRGEKSREGGQANPRRTSCTARRGYPGTAAPQSRSHQSHRVGRRQCATTAFARIQLTPLDCSSRGSRHRRGRSRTYRSQGTAASTPRRQLGPVVQASRRLPQWFRVL